MSSNAARYADFNTACSRCQQIIQTIDLTFQQGIFIYDLTFIQQELESVLLAAFQREQQLLNNHGEYLTLPTSSMAPPVNGKKPRDFKAERERRRKAFNGQVTRKRRMKKKINPLPRQRSSVSSLKRSMSSTIDRSETTNGHSKRPIRSYRAMNFTSTFLYDHQIRNGHHTNGKSHSDSLPLIEQFWKKIVEEDFLTKDQCQSIEKLIENDEFLLKNFDDEKEAQQIVQSKEFFLSSKDYRNPLLTSAVVMQQNEHFHAQWNRIKKKIPNKNRSNGHINGIDTTAFDYLRRDQRKFSSKSAELEYLLNESICLERLALTRAEKQYEQDRIYRELVEIDEKIFEITNSIRQRKRPSESAISTIKSISPIDQPSENEAWRKGRRQSTLRVYDELARLLDQRMELEKQLDFTD